MEFFMTTLSQQTNIFPYLSFSPILFLSPRKKKNLKLISRKIQRLDSGSASSDVRPTLPICLFSATFINHETHA